MKTAHSTLNTYVLMPGSWQKFRSTDHIKERFEKAGDMVLGLTLEIPPPGSTIQNKVFTLRHHIKYITDQIINLDLNNVVLCGENYGGLVITGVGDEIPERINALIYMDGYIPDNSDVKWKVISDINPRLFVTNRCPASTFHTPALQTYNGMRRLTDRYTLFQKENKNIELPSKWPVETRLGADENQKRTIIEINKNHTGCRIQSLNGGRQDLRSPLDRLTAIILISVPPKKAVHIT
jgi:pimeloyl-ACP methyl ester carboxylesterase